MRINVSQLKKELGASEKVEFIEEISQEFLPKGIKIQGPVEIKASVVNAGESFVLKGRLNVPVKMCCDRCLGEYQTKLNAPLEEEYYPLTENEEASLRDMEKATYKDNVIDITPLVEEAIILAIPMTPLCREDCKGLCAQCGQDLNQESCNCDHEVVDIRLEALKKLLDS